MKGLPGTVFPIHHGQGWWGGHSYISLSTGGVAYKKAVSDGSSKYFKPQSALKQKTPKHFRGIFNLVAGDPKLAANRER